MKNKALLISLVVGLGMSINHIAPQSGAMSEYVYAACLSDSSSSSSSGGGLVNSVERQTFDDGSTLTVRSVTDDNGNFVSESVTFTEATDSSTGVSDAGSASSESASSDSGGGE